MQAILMLAHKNIKQIIELTAILNRRFIVYIHLDKKCKLSQSDKNHAQQTIVNDGPKIGRNDPCPCGSGKKYKNCCGRNQ